MGDQALMQAALSGYLSNYEPSKQQAVLDHIRLYMKIKISETAYPTKLPVQPLSVQQLVNNKENVQP